MVLKEYSLFGQRRGRGKVGVHLQRGGTEERHSKVTDIFDESDIIKDSDIADTSDIIEDYDNLGVITRYHTHFLLLCSSDDLEWADSASQVG